MSEMPGIGVVPFRGRRERDPRWWGETRGSAVCAIFGAAAVFKAGSSGGDPSGLTFGVLCFAAGAAGLAVVVPHRVAPEPATGVTVSWVRSNTQPSTAFAAVVVLRSERDRLDVLLVDADGAGQVLCRPGTWSVSSLRWPLDVRST